MSALKEALRADIFSYESALSTTPFLSKIYHAEVALLALLEETNHGKPADAPRAEDGLDALNLAGTITKIWRER